MWAGLVPGFMGAGLVLGFVLKSGPQFSPIPPLGECLTPRLVALAWGLGDLRNVRLSFLLSSVHLFLFLCSTQVL